MYVYTYCFANIACQKFKLVTTIYEQSIKVIR